MRVQESKFPGCGTFTLTAENDKEYRILEMLVAGLRGRYGSPDPSKVDPEEEGGGGDDDLRPEDDPMVLLSDGDGGSCAVETEQPLEGKTRHFPPKGDG